MKIYSLEQEMVVSRPREEVFAFFERPENLAVITPPSMSFRIITPTPVIMQVGTLIDYTVRIMGVRRHWRTYIAEYQAPEKFVDVQLKGPYIFWHHTHRFIEKGGSTTIVDEVKYMVPFGILGRAVHALLIRRQLASIFSYRATVIGRLFGHVAAERTESAGEI
jgi:ligand-binding SRPBCC domain-containing protein